MEGVCTLLGQHIALNEPCEAKMTKRSLQTAAAFANAKNACANPPHEAYEPRPGFANPTRLAEPLPNPQRELQRAART